ncbi:alpha/beta fold hydrolase [Sphingomonas sp.]|uniref:alpha/beta fold hydrolase n=1 Tax=Sphingomonas sp. TaxID=28214 RepID=UPI002DD6731C|nr:alpha/beta hydrolase [Sphingomonas sp.]
MTIAASVAGPQGGSSVLFLHGIGQTRHSWGAAISSLGAAGFRAVALDARGHGDSAWADDGRYDVDALADDLQDVLEAIGPAVLVGASMGGLTSLLVAGERRAPQVQGLVLVDVVPRVEREGTAEIFAFMTGNPDGFESLDAAAHAIAAFLPNRKRVPNPAGLSKNLRLGADGRYRWHWDPAVLTTRSPDARVRLQRHEAAAEALDIPTMVIRGGGSRVVSMDGVEAFLRLAPHARFVNIDRAEHMVAGDANDAFNAPLIDFLQGARAAADVQA